MKRIKKETDDLAVFCNYWVKMEKSSFESGRLENVSVQIRGKVGNKIPWATGITPSRNFIPHFPPYLYRHVF